MSVAENQAAVPTPKLRWFHLTPGRFVVGLLAVEVLLWLSERPGWLEWHKGYAVLTGVGTVAVAMILLFVWFGVALVFRWPFQFSIRSLLVLVVVVAMPCGWLAVEMKNAREQKEAVHAIENLAMFVVYDWQVDANGQDLLSRAQPPGLVWLRNLLGDDFFVSVAGTSLCGAEVTDSVLARLKGMVQLRSVYLANSQVTDTGLENLRGLSQLRELSLCDTQITDAGLECTLTGLTTLRCLWLDNTQVTSSGIAHIKNLTELEVLSLDGTKVTDAGLEYVKGLPRLQKLWLSRTLVTDAGLKYLEELPRLRELSLEQTRITDAGLERLGGFTHLETLTLVDTKVSDAGLDKLRGLRQLQHLYLNKPVGDQGVKNLQRMLPHCKIHYQADDNSPFGLEWNPARRMPPDVPLCRCRVAGADVAMAPETG